MKKLLSILYIAALLVVLMPSIKVEAAELSGTCGENATWELSEGVLTIKGTGDTVSYGIFELPWEEQVEEIKTFIVEDGITSVGNRYCDGAKYLTSASLPESVTSIGDNVFWGCHNLKDIKLPSNLKSMGKSMLVQCRAMEHIDIPEGVTVIRERTFDACRNLKTITLPSSLEKIEKYAFWRCEKLESIVLPPTVSEIGEVAFEQCYGLKYICYPKSVEADLYGPRVLEGITPIWMSYVENSDGTVSVTVEKLPESAEAKVVLPSGVYGKRIKSVSFAEGIDGSLVKLTCEKHMYVNGNSACVCGYIPFTYTSQAKQAVLNCDYKDDVVLSVSAVPASDDVKIQYQWYENDQKINGAVAATYTVPQGKAAGTYYYHCVISYDGYSVTSDKSCIVINEKPVLKKGAKFKDAKKTAWYKVTSPGARTGKIGTVEYVKPVKKTAKSVTIPATVTYDGIKYKVTGIAQNAFKKNKSLVRVTIGKNVKSIGKQAFYGCKRLTLIKIKTTNLKANKVGKQAFKGISPKATIELPKKKYKAYKAWLRKKGAAAAVKYKVGK